MKPLREALKETLIMISLNSPEKSVQKRRILKLYENRVLNKTEVDLLFIEQGLKGA